jgi:hypothetical protein
MARGPESQLEERFVKEVERRGGLALKFKPPGSNGWPDRVMLCPGGLAVFVELKAQGEKPRKLQRVRHRELRDLGHVVYTADTWEVCRAIIEQHLPSGD